MNGSPDINSGTPADEGDVLEAVQAADILDRATRRARRQFDANPPVLGVLNAVIVLVAYGAVWLSVRGQHPYDGLRVWLIVLIAMLARLVFTLAIGFFRHATKGVSGSSSRPWWAEVAAVTVVLAAVLVFMAALVHAGADHVIAYGVYPAAVPLIVVGGTLAGFLAARADWPGFAAALAVVCVGAGSAFAGPAGAWGVAGLGACLALLGHTAATAWLRQPKAAR